MKNSYSLALFALAGQVIAFPASVSNAIAADPAKYKRLSKRLNGISPGFNASAQYISTSGDYKWVAPGPTDQRGPCPGLNAFANHGYIPHNGIATIQQFIDATTSVVGMGEDLAGFLSIYGAIFDGDLTSWSIGGPDSRVGVPLLGTPLNLLGTPQGISGSHNKYESDVSPSRGDLYQYGNDYLVVVEQFKNFFATQASLPDSQRNYDIGAQTNYRVRRFAESMNENPYFFNGPFSGVLVQPAAYTFQYRFMANHSEASPEGQLTGSVLKTWFSITGKYPNFKYTAGHERIPDNWYRRAFGDEYTIPFFLQDVVGMAVEYPQFLDIGGNTNGTNTFTGLDLGNITGGLYNVKDFTDPQTLACFQYQLVTQAQPDILLNGITLTETVLDMLQEAGGLLIANATCPELSSVQVKQFKKGLSAYPGFAKLKLKSGKY